MRAREFIKEDSFPASQADATPDMRSHPSLDNSSPYDPWRFAGHFLAGADGKIDRKKATEEAQGAEGKCNRKADQHHQDQPHEHEGRKLFDGHCRGLSYTRFISNSPRSQATIAPRPKRLTVLE